MRLLPFVVATLLAGVPGVAAGVEERADERIVVYGDLFSRWDETRWFVATEVAMPFPVTLRADRNVEFRTQMFQLKAVLFCYKKRRQGLRHQLVDCRIEDFGMEAAAVREMSRRRPEVIQRVLDEIDTKLTGAWFQLRVSQDGRVKSIDLEGWDPRNRREYGIAETLRMVMGRLIVGFDMKLRGGNDLQEGTWAERNPQLFSMPIPADFQGPGNGVPSLGPASRNTAMLVHQLHAFRGQTVVQSVGRGTIRIGEGRSVNTFQGHLTGVSIYDRAEGYMTERVWALTARTTPSSGLSEVGVATYWHGGRIRWLGEDGVADVGPTRQVAPPSHAVSARQRSNDELPPWTPLDPL